MQAAHGFVDQHPWAPSIGVVINVEATGSHGPDVLFRETGAGPRLRARAPPRSPPRRPSATSCASSPSPWTRTSAFRGPTLRNLRASTSRACSAGRPTTRTRTSSLASVRSPSGVRRKRREGRQRRREGVTETNGGRRHDPRAEPATRAGESGAFFDVYFLEGFAIDSRGASRVLHAAPLLACIVDFALGGASRRASYASGVRVSAKSFALTLAAPALLGAARAVVSRASRGSGDPRSRRRSSRPPRSSRPFFRARAQLKHGPIARLGRARGDAFAPRSPRFSASRTPPSRRSSRRTRSARRSSCSPSPRASPSGRRSSRWRCSPPASRSPRPSRRSRRPSSPKRWASPARSPGRSDSRSGTSSWASRSGSASTSSE